MKISIVGSGFSGLSAAAYLAKAGHDVTVVEKNTTLGGRARKFIEEGFTFDMGPSWYWMPEVFEDFYNDFGRKTSDFYNLVRLDPSYRVYFDRLDFEDIPAEFSELKAFFDKHEDGASKKLESFLKDAQYKYEVGMGEFVRKPSLSIREFLDLRILKSAIGLNMFSSVSKEIRALFSNERLIQILEFPVLFLGATPQDTPALYSLMNYADLKLGTWYPMGGMNKIVEAFVAIAKSNGVKFVLQEEIIEAKIQDNKVSALVSSNGTVFEQDVVVAASDYHNFDNSILPPKFQTYSSSYWDSRVMAPSSLLFYIGVNRKIPGLKHHTLFFDADFDKHAQEIYKSKKWPTEPLFYMCAPSVSDPSVAPEGMENIFLLMPLAAGIDDTEELRERYFDVLISRLNAIAGVDVSEHICFKRSFCVKDFKNDYNSYRGNAYGLANTLKQTAFLKPRMKSKKLNNLYYTGQLTTPGPGVPPAIISGEVVAKLINTLKL